MVHIQELYDARVKRMAPAERLQLARLILDDLAPTDSGAVSYTHLTLPTNREV